jgi:RHS repeat-associated protein
MMSELHCDRHGSVRSRALALLIAAVLCGSGGSAAAQGRAVVHQQQAQPESMPVAETQTQTRLRGSSVAVTLPNGYANQIQDDLVVESRGGTVRWSRVWDGQEWKFNPYWESLSQSWKNLTGSQTADTSGSAVAGTPSGTVQFGSSSATSTTDMGGCWVWVDEDWTPSIGSVVIGGPPVAAPMAPERMTPFNRIMGEDELNYAQPVRVSVDFASLCAGSLVSSGVRDLEGIRRQNELYLGEQGRYAFSNRAVLEKRAVQAIPEIGSAGLAQLSTGTFTPQPATNDKGYRWIHREGDWIDYNTQGQAVAYGDRNDNVVWIVRDQNGAVRGVVDAAGHVVYTLHYTGPLLTEVRDYPMAGNSLDLPARSVSYQYDGRNRLAQVTDVRGHTIRYGYDDLNRITSVTDQEGRIERFEYSGDTVSKRTAPDGTVTEYLFEYDDANKQFTSKITGPDTSAGRRVEDYTHNRSGKLVRRIVNGRIEEEVRYDTGARAELHTNARGFVTRITRNEFEQVVRIDYPDGTNQQRSFSALHLQLTEESDEAGVKTQYQYDAKGNLRKRIDAVGTPVERTIDYEVNALGQTIGVTLRGRTEANGVVTADASWTYEYDSKGQLSKAIDPEGNVRLYVYSRAGDLVRYTDPRSNATRYEVNASGDLTGVTDALSRSTAFTYDKVGNITSILDARGHAIQAAYDAMNRRTEITNPVGGISRTQYNGEGLPILETDEDGRTAHAQFDPFLRLTREVDAVGNIIEYSYALPDGSGNAAVGALFDPTEIRFPTFTERQRYDQRERPTSRTLLNGTSLGTEGLVSSTTYDKRGLIATHTDEDGKTSFYAYDALGGLIETTDSLGKKTNALYDVRGNLLQMRDAKGNVNRFEYDRDNRLVKEVLPLGQTTTYEYDAAGNLATRINANGHRSIYEYDAANRLREIRRYRAGGVLVRTTSFTWDNADNLVGWTDTDATRPSGQQVASSIAVYDDADRKTRETITYPLPQGGSYSLTYQYDYSLAGYKTRLTWPDGTAIDYGYSAHGELQSIVIPGEGTISVNHFKWLAPERITLPGGTTQARAYDGLLNLEELKVRTPGQQSIVELANTYGKLQELATSTRVDTVGGVSSGRAATYTYDDEARLTEVATTSGVFGNDTETFTLDAVGNRIAYNKVAGAWTYDANNRLLQKGSGAGATSYDYDDAGNLIRKTEPGSRITQYVYDTQNRLVEVRDGAGNLIARYGYDIFDVRLWKEQYRDRGGNALAPAKRTYYLHADEGLIAEAEQAADLTVNAGQPALVTQYGPQPDAEFTTGTLFVKTRNSNGSSTIAYFHNDQLDTPISASDRNGNLVWAAAYDVFGAATITTPAPTAERPTIANNLRFAGQYADEETGLHYNLRRYYDPGTGRYISQDPVGLAGGDNLYRYADADPANLTDPTGECPQCVAYAVCLALCMAEDVAENAITGECNNFGSSAKNCALGCAVGMGLGKLWKWGRKLLKRNRCGPNSFDAQTLVHVRPDGSTGDDAQLGRTQLREISSIKVGDEVLALSEWKNAGSSDGRDARLSYEKVTDVYTSFKEQVLVHLTLEDGTTLTATEGHPFKTAEGWRDAIMLRKGGKLLLMGGAEDASERVALIADVQLDRRVVPVHNLQVANAHSFFVGTDAALVHNGNGSYTCYFKSDKTYSGKGGMDRAKKSARRLEKKHRDKLDRIDWTKAKNRKDAFRQEYKRQKRHGGPQGGPGGDGSNYNKRWSPGRNM